MASAKLFLGFVLISALAIAGMALEPSKGAPSDLRYFITDVGQFLIIAFAAAIGIKQAKAFSFGSALGKSLLFISIGLLFWGFGALTWLYYNIAMKLEVPYPSIADALFVGTVLSASWGLFWLLKSIKNSFDAGTIIKLAVIPVAVFAVTYILFIQSKLVENVSGIEKALNVFYPVGDAVFLSFTIVLLTLIRGGKMFKPISIICAGFIIQSMADFSFSWTTSAGTYYTGNWVDILFSLAFFTIGAGMYYTKDLLDVK
ncbi:MAG: hypothetical protein ABIF85_01525 [Nanoarchaeota archaeon]|nr:hypothetical protein [Nanoarchaeota archaeon]MBU4299740.1 hypothetical protein [Nanoarchaeota archaeon]MBU4452554.1 hypothetical protein [Nanoarchaeota archaeon]MCG2723519.1 hypothetical protein [archaeon]